MIEEVEEAGGAPRWMATFADLMSLLMCFFVLLLSFSEMDVQKYKLVAGSMKNAFGVQQERIALNSPVGTQEEIITTPEQVATPEQQMIQEIQELVAETERDINKLEESLDSEVSGGQLDLESGFRSITIRIKEQGSFNSGSADLQPAFVEVMTKLRNVLKDVNGKISVEGHSDNIAINTSRFPSNWALSSARALSVAHALMENDEIPNERFLVVGFAVTKPFQTNDTAVGRASNRRVEIHIRQEISEEVDANIRELSESNPDFVNSLDVVESE